MAISYNCAATDHRLNMFLILVLYYIFPLITCNVKQSDKPVMPQTMGIKIENDIKIDKDTIITRNMKLERRGNQKGNSNTEPDWSYSKFPKEISQYVQEFKRNMSECLKEVQANDKREIKRLSPKMESPVHGECLIACVLKKNGVIERGKVNRDNLIGLVNKFYAKEDKLVKKLERNIDKCINISIKNKDECELAARLNQCTNDILIANNKHKVKGN